jgi:hypothetical protein
MSRRWTMAFVAVVLLGTAIAVVVAQEQPKAPVVPDAGAKKAVPAPDRPAAKEARKTDALSLRARAEQAAMARMLKMMSTAPAIAVAGDHVYVVKGNVLYQFAVDGLRLVAKAELEPPAAPEKAAREALKRRKVEREPAPGEVR